MALFFLYSPAPRTRQRPDSRDLRRRSRKESEDFMISTTRLNEKLLQAEYAVRGPIVQRAQELEARGKKIIYCNIGNPQALKQRPLTYMRQLLCLVEYPALLENPALVAQFPKDIVERARFILAKHAHGTGAYTQSAGIPFIRQAVADFIAKRDGIPTDPARVILTDGASKGAQAVLTALLRTPQDGFMIPIPQYPLYSASLTLFGGRAIGYYLDEHHHWQLSEEILAESLAVAQKAGIHAVGLVVINPGNPTGAVLSRENIEMVIGFAQSHQLALIADEVYQENVYASGSAFHSFAKVMHALGDTETPLFSLHSVSKGFLGECGHRGGYLEMRNIPEEVLAQFIKLQSISLCANTPGQLVTYLMVAPPQPGDESYDRYLQEKNGILEDLKKKAEILGEGLNRVPGMSVDVPQGAMYAFVRFELPVEPGVHLETMTEKEREAHLAKRDNAYCLTLLEETGICVVPGSGFGQLPGTLHFRTTFLPPREEIQELVARLGEFHRRYTLSRVTDGRRPAVEARSEAGSPRQDRPFRKGA
jgi:aspartate/methionine/tyrosine aminotransferase